MSSWLQSTFAIAMVLLIAAAPVEPEREADRRPAPRDSYRLPRNREINLFNEVGTRVWYAHMLVNPAHGTRSAYYGSDPDTVAHQLASSAVQRYEVKATELIRIRLFDEDPARVAPQQQRGREYQLEAGQNYRLVRNDNDEVGIWRMAKTGIVKIRNQLGESLSYDLIQVDSDGQNHRMTIDLAPKGTNYHNVRGTIECVLGLPNQRFGEQRTIAVTAGESYVFRRDPQGRLTSAEGNWDLFPVEDDEEE